VPAERSRGWSSQPVERKSHVQPLHALLARLADRDARRSEATVQADVRALLLASPFNLAEVDVLDVSLE